MSIGKPVQNQEGMMGCARVTLKAHLFQGKFEVEDGRLQLVYTMKDDKFFEVSVDHNTANRQKPNRLQEETISPRPKRKPKRWPKPSRLFTT